VVRLARAAPRQPDLLIGDGDSAIDPNGRPLNIGSELACDGIDENQNGVTDDVDKGKDGLCDCLRIGFLGALASSNGRPPARSRPGWKSAATCPSLTSARAIRSPPTR
jgi:hypothetical protein